MVTGNVRTDALDRNNLAGTVISVDYHIQGESSYIIAHLGDINMRAGDINVQVAQSRQLSWLLLYPNISIWVEIQEVY